MVEPRKTTATDGLAGLGLKTLETVPRGPGGVPGTLRHAAASRMRARGRRIENYELRTIPSLGLGIIS